MKSLPSPSQGICTWMSWFFVCGNFMATLDYTIHCYHWFWNRALIARVAPQKIDQMGLINQTTLETDFIQHLCSHSRVDNWRSYSTYGLRVWFMGKPHEKTTGFFKPRNTGHYYWTGPKAYPCFAVTLDFQYIRTVLYKKEASKSLS